MSNKINDFNATKSHNLASANLKDAARQSKEYRNAKYDTELEKSKLDIDPKVVNEAQDYMSNYSVEKDTKGATFTVFLWVIAGLTVVTILAFAYNFIFNFLFV